MWTPHRGLAAPNTQVSTLAGQLQLTGAGRTHHQVQGVLGHIDADVLVHLGFAHSRLPYTLDCPNTARTCRCGLEALATVRARRGWVRRPGSTAGSWTQSLSDCRTPATTESLRLQHISKHTSSQVAICGVTLRRACRAHSATGTIRVLSAAQPAEESATLAVTGRRFVERSQARGQDLAVDDGCAEHVVRLAQPPIRVLVTEPASRPQLLPQSRVVHLLVGDGLQQSTHRAHR